MAFVLLSSLYGFSNEILEKLLLKQELIQVWWLILMGGINFQSLSQIRGLNRSHGMCGHSSSVFKSMGARWEAATGEP
jgi:hypothetical protein